MKEIPPEQAAMAPFLQGWLAQELSLHGRRPDRLMKISGVDIHSDRHGDLEPYMIVRFESGAAVKVSFEAVDPDAVEIDQAITSIKGD